MDERPLRKRTSSAWAKQQGKFSVIFSVFSVPLWLIVFWIITGGWADSWLLIASR